MKLGKLILAAFNARPLGMFVAPNWIGLGLFAALGFLNEGFWIIGAGLEVGYLTVLLSNRRFLAAAEAQDTVGKYAEGQRKMEEGVKTLGMGDQSRYRALEGKCKEIMRLPKDNPHALDSTVQAEGLGRLLYTYLKLLQTRDAIQKVISRAANNGTLDQTIQRVREQAASDKITPELRHSLESQLDILQQRQRVQGDAGGKIAFVEAEMARIEQQVELIREGLSLNSDPELLSKKIDEVGATLSNTGEWIKDQGRLYAEVGDLLDDSPPVAVSA